MDIQRLRNMTTGRLHTKVEHLYEDLEAITGARGLMIHMLPRVMESVEPWLRKHVTDDRFWDGKYDTTNNGKYTLPEPTESDRAAMFERYMAMPGIVACAIVKLRPLEELEQKIFGR